MGTGVSGPPASAGRLWRTRRHGSTERRVARRPHQASRTLAGRLTVEPSSVRAACVVQADERVRPSTRRPAPRVCAGRPRADAPRTHPVGGSQQPCRPPREPSPPACRRSRKPTRPRGPVRGPRCESAARPRGSPSRRPCRGGRQGSAAPRWSARRWRAGALGWPPAVWTASLAIGPLVWPGTRPPKSGWSRRAAGPGGRGAACSARGARAPQMLGACTGKA